MNDVKNMNHLFDKLVVSIKSRFTKRYKNVWLFGEWFGNRICDNSMCFANYIVENHPDIKVYWAANPGIDISGLDDRIRVISRKSSKSISLYKKAGVIIMNQGIGDFSDDALDYYSGAVTVNLWHGVPWKKILIDSIDKHNKIEYLIIKYGFLLTRAKYFLSLSDEFTKVLKKSGGLRDKNIIKAGYPRNALFYDENKVNEARNKIVEMIRNNGTGMTDKTKIIGYMPTFRDSGSETFSFNDISEKISDYLEENDVVIVEKKHYEDSTGQKNVACKRIVNLPDCSAQDLLAASNLLVTDYSSCFFDYLVLDRPIVHYIYDYDYYANKDRGLYYSKDEVVCGDVVTTQSDLIDSIKKNIDNPSNNKELRLLRKQRYMQFEKENSCEEIYNFIMRKLERR